jgi:cytoplasmic iron level regulating protein YaaA (DUF328/UPF0246 family)
VSAVYVLLPPSETKSIGGNGPELALDRLSFPSLTPTRARLLQVLQEDGGGPTGRTSPALLRYTGVLYSVLDVAGMSATEYGRAAQRVMICSALFGLLSARDSIPSYKFSSGSRLPGLPTVAALWRASLPAVLATLDEPVLDLRSGAYAAFAPAEAIPGAITVRVVTVTRSGELKPVSHANKSIKGALARVVATTRAEVRDVPGLLRVARRGGLSVDRTGPGSIDLIAPPAH